MAVQLFKELLERNKAAQADYRAPPRLGDLAQNGGREMVFIISCADNRIEPVDIFKINTGEAAILRNAGGRVTEDTFRSMSVMGTIGRIAQVVILHHTDCGGLLRTDPYIATRLSERRPSHAHECEGKVFGTFQHIGIDESVRQDVAKVNAWPFLPKGVPVVGYVFETENGGLRQVE